MYNIFLNTNLGGWCAFQGSRGLLKNSSSIQPASRKFQIVDALPKAKCLTTVITVKHLLYLKYVIPMYELLWSGLAPKITLRTNVRFRLRWKIILNNYPHYRCFLHLRQNVHVQIDATDPLLQASTFYWRTYGGRKSNSKASEPQDGGIISPILRFRRFATRRFVRGGSSNIAHLNQKMSSTTHQPQPHMIINQSRWLLGHHHI